MTPSPEGLAAEAPSAAEITAMRHEIAYLKAEAVVRNKWVEVLEGRVQRLTPPADCPYDGRTCYVSAGTDDAHYRCGTGQCGRPLRARSGQ